ncbi:protein disulfide oxidoreductase [Psychromonas hadalis]|uniref:protein disulfide oxidoreductase n=1 Tax=Psychromonas hadalis TaxID=211669 RepID=UPI0003B7A963|nr:protein disulfide oxidoreductase [Psychromonas hadalis]
MDEPIKKKSAIKRRKGWLGWLKEAVIFITIIVVVGWGADLWRSQSIVSGQAPELISQSIVGNEVDLIAMSQDKPVLVYFWATWCAVCSGVSPSVDFIASNYQVVTVALTSGKEARIKQYMNAKEYNFTVVNDPKGEISRSWGVSVTPTIFVIDKGEITSVTTGFTSPIGMWLRLLLA